MLLRYFYDEKLAHASYVVGCQKTGEAVVVDPMRDITAYEELAKEEKLNIVGALETHIHADFVSGSRELNDRFGTKLYVSDEGDADWKYQNLDGISHQLLKDGDQFKIGNLVFDVMHTPGHTPESISFLLTDKGGSADKPMGIFTGDFVFVGDVGRPDLLEKAADIQGTSDSGAASMFKSIERFKALPDYLQVWPAHGAGSACGKALGAVPSTTVGYEKAFNWAMQFDDEASFKKALLEGQPEPPYYFAVMKSVNKVGQKLIKDLPELKEITSAADIEALLAEGKQVLDMRPADAYSKGHIQGTLNIPFNNSFTNWAGWIVDYDKPLYLLLDTKVLDEALVALRSVGIDEVYGFAEADSLMAQAENLASYENVSPSEANEMVENSEAYVLDVRNQTEFDEGHIDNAQHIMVGTLKNRLDEVDTDKTIIVQCQAGARSAIAASVLKANGIDKLVNMTGGYSKWQQEVASVKQ
ncbi:MULTISPECIES: rhodanese-like domain-containing protein [unclassified Planococcus (in: firmicutes)]|uniref:MBL fold metallo-hydrolase n=1 Tax=unclassified Planococcus (in: firmicutes) TaxID=2662419 RepID=UPI000C31D2A1|nr:MULTISPECIES: MBL fold metallo-hydrolase [unclassified Planococcus (in: firmicutes)]AUD14750.1 MBL fold metallo-hydrolase [Planococcus sp. MB-3u-03]PKG45061.1 MBL fold metallo-hydrolase [Planococcus sp. Urea-trap-24]PKG87404.1 MBL fold metallo-hydrolase [Planococcus sp. Urea-3u-39]PKH42529.1 MBL fold metallo-hydrolase [Planococcus sp. MB-3u-09]